MPDLRSLVFGVVLTLAPVAGASGAADSVTSYHNGPERTGNYVVPGLTWERARGLHADPAFRAEFAGHVYAQPLYWRGNLIVVTEDDSVEAIDGKTGREVWRRGLGTPVPRSALPCGDIDPLGVTGTPVIDAANGVAYLDAAVMSQNGPRHEVFAIALANGTIVSGWPVDVGAALIGKGANFIARDQNQRGALAMQAERIYVAYSGHFGDCGDYRGWVAGIAIANPRDVVHWFTAARGGGIWAPGGVVSDGRSLLVATGNTFGASSWAGGEAVIRLSPELTFSNRPQDYFAPGDWHALDQSDLDLGGANPLPFELGGRRYVLALGKDGRAYLLDGDNLGGIGGAVVVSEVAPTAIRTSPALFMAGSATAFVVFQGTAGAQCTSRGGLTMLRITGSPRPTIATAWCGVASGRGSPIVTTTDGTSNPIVWIVGAEGDGRLHGFNGETGAVLFDGPANAMTGTRRFQTLIATPDRIYVAADGRIYAFAF